MFPLVASRSLLPASCSSLLASLILLLTATPAAATTWLVGPSRSYTAPSKVSSLVQDGDTIDIDAGVYESDVTRWSANNLVLRGVGGMAHLKANGANYGGKAIWVMSGKNTTVEFVEFSLCKCIDQNGAGIRQEGDNLTVRHCYFHDNEDGILGGGSSASDLLIEHSEFYNNGFGDGFSHNLYIGNINSLTFQFNYSHHAVVGHELKSRAAYNYILYNRLANEATGTASREIDLPNGGTAIIIGNEIQQGTQGNNSGIVGYGLEGLSNPATHQLLLVNNTIVNDRGAGTFVSVQNGTELFKAYNNILAGPGARLTGSPATIDTANNLVTSIAAVGFVDATTYDYTLLATSPAINGGTSPRLSGTYPLAPSYQYVHPADKAIRIPNGQIDIGAHEYGAASEVALQTAQTTTITFAPNPLRTSTVISVIGERLDGVLVLYTTTGEEVARVDLSGQPTLTLPRGNLPTGIYLYRIIRKDGVVVAVGQLGVEG